MAEGGPSIEEFARPYGERETPRNESNTETVFDGGTFRLLALTTDTEGLTIETRNSIGRREGHEPNPSLLTPEQRTSLKDVTKGVDGRKGEMDFNKVALVKESRSRLKDVVDAYVTSGKLTFSNERNNVYPPILAKDENGENIPVDDSEQNLMNMKPEELETLESLDSKKLDTDERRKLGNLRNFMLATKEEGFVDSLDDELKDVYNDFRTKQSEYIAKGKKAGFRNMKIVGNTVTIDVQDANFTTYKILAKEGNTDEAIDLGKAVGTAMALLTKGTDTDTPKFILQHRSERNALYGGVPGASSAGMLDTKRETPDRLPGTPDPVDTNFVTDNMLKETREELNLARDNVKLTPVAIAEDTVQIHDEVLYLGQSDLTSEEIIKQARKSNRNEKLGDADFEEKFVMIDGTLPALETLLTEMKCPLPPTHSATFLSAAYFLKLQEVGGNIEEANKWKESMEIKIKANSQEINRRVAEFTNGESVAYTPSLTPEKQGLPSFDSEMARLQSHLQPWKNTTQL